MSEGVGLAEEILDKILSVGESGAVIVTKKRSRQLRFSVNKMDVAKEWEETTISVLVEKEKKMLVTELSMHAIRRLDVVIDRLRSALKLVPPKPYYAPLPEPSEKYPEIPDSFDKETIEDQVAAEMARLKEEVGRSNFRRQAIYIPIEEASLVRVTAFCQVTREALEEEVVIRARG